MLGLGLGFEVEKRNLLIRMAHIYILWSAGRECTMDHFDCKRKLKYSWLVSFYPFLNCELIVQLRM